MLLAAVLMAALSKPGPPVVAPVRIYKLQEDAFVVTSVTYIHAVYLEKTTNSFAWFTNFHPDRKIATILIRTGASPLHIVVETGPRDVLIRDRTRFVVKNPLGR